MINPLNLLLNHAFTLVLLLTVFGRDEPHQSLQSQPLVMVVVMMMTTQRRVEAHKIQ